MEKDRRNRNILTNLIVLAMFGFLIQAVSTKIYFNNINAKLKELKENIKIENDKLDKTVGIELKEEKKI